MSAFASTTIFSVMAINDDCLILYCDREITMNLLSNVKKKSLYKEIENKRIIVFHYYFLPV